MAYSSSQPYRRLVLLRNRGGYFTEAERLEQAACIRTIYEQSMFLCNEICPSLMGHFPEVVAK